ncbi:hypothetical protein CDD82_6058 [Ophiocordyceps australis]|uniref:TRIP4/RQT4 C2HC5-type zinc finger domain-containing protein n=1 Tax=Ophiocordyceps australis TaxID=1399860 RepID=A0A2C5YXK1_9HYPO|nr:hypothetical protein CDD82_6058 [Ophiocordyceps australis]
MSLAQLSQLLPLPQEELQQILEYAATLSKPDAAVHFSNLLGDSPLAVDFISTFNSRRNQTQPEATPNVDAVPKTKRGPKKKPAIHTPVARKANEYAGPATTAYSKKTGGLEYIAQQRPSVASSSNASPSATPISRAQTPVKQPLIQQASGAGYLMSDVPPAKTKSNLSGRNSEAKPSSDKSTKISMTGGTPMKGESTALADLDAAIRALEITTNPTIDGHGARPKCNCVAARHPLQKAAPNCLSCGKVVCIKEGLGPCTFCGAALLRPEEVQSMIRELKEERGRERMAANAAVHRRPDVSKTPAPFTQARSESDTKDKLDENWLAEAAARARDHRDKLLSFQAQNARRTVVRDEAADFDVSGAFSGTGSMWASPEERAREMKRQQKLMREMEWNALPDYEKRRQVLSIDVVGGKVLRKMAPVERPRTSDTDQEDGSSGEETEATARGGGAFSRNPLLGALVRPLYGTTDEHQNEHHDEHHDKDTRASQGPGQGSKKWRRVQDDVENNDAIILDGGVQGHAVVAQP